jgi:hypothetical protein
LRSDAEASFHYLPRSNPRSLAGNCCPNEETHSNPGFLDWAGVEAGLSTMNEEILFAKRPGWSDEDAPVGIKAADRRQHLYVIGKTGSGKTTLLRNMLVQHIALGHGVGLIDPHGDLAAELLDQIPSSRADHLVYFNPGDLDFPVGLNLLANVAPDDRHLVASGKVWFAQRSPATAALERLPIPATSRSLFQNGSKLACYVTANRQLDLTICAAQIPDMRFGDFGGHGVGLHLDVPIQSVGEFKRFLGLLHNELELSSEGSFTITQSSHSWHGFGISNLVGVVKRWKQRYREAALEHTHHSENIIYFDSCSYGLLVVRTRQAVQYASKGRLDLCNLEIHLRGIPLDPRPFARISREASASTPVFEPFHETHFESVRLPVPVCVEPIGEVISTLDSANKRVSGLIIKNPFRQDAKLLTGELHLDTFRDLSATDHLILELSDWHDLGDTIDQYRMTRLEGMQTGGAAIYRCVGTWDSIIKRARPRPKPLDVRGFRRLTRRLILKYGGQLDSKHSKKKSPRNKAARS